MENESAKIVLIVESFAVETQRSLRSLEEANSRLFQQMAEITKDLKEIKNDLDSEDDASNDLEACEDISDLVTFMEDWLDKDEIKEVIQFLNDNHKYRLALSGSEERLLERLDDEDEIDFDHLKEAIEETIDLDE